METNEKQAYLLGYMKAMNEVMTDAHREISSDKMAQFSANILIEMAQDLEIPMPPKEMTRSATELYHAMGDILEKWEYR